jgi:hypothetical protein
MNSTDWTISKNGNVWRKLGNITAIIGFDKKLNKYYTILKFPGGVSKSLELADSPKAAMETVDRLVGVSC